MIAYQAKNDKGQHIRVGTVHMRGRQVQNIHGRLHILVVVVNTGKCQDVIVNHPTEKPLDLDEIFDQIETFTDKINIDFLLR